MDDQLYNLFYQFEDTNWWFVGRRKLALSLLKACMAGHQRNQTNVLDVGCGTGVMLQHLDEFGEVTGIDIAGQALSYCHQRGNTRLVAADAKTLPFPEDEFALITVLDVIEHIDDDVGVLDDLSRVCASGGKVLITVPAYQSLWSTHDIVNQHKRRYTADAVRMKVEEAGFAVVRMTYANTFLFPVVLVVRMIKNLFFRKRNTSDWDMNDVPRLANVLLTWIYGWESFFLKRMDFPFGVSVVCLAEKP